MAAIKRDHMRADQGNPGAGRAGLVLACLALMLAAVLQLSGCCVVGDRLGSAVGGSDEGDAATVEATQSDPSQTFAMRSFSAGTLDGGTFTQDDIAACDYTIVYFWGITCGYCIEEMPDIAQYERELPQNVQLITVCFDAQTDLDYAHEVMGESGFEGPTLVSGDGDYLNCWRNVRYTPTVVVLDSEGNQLTEPLVGAPIDLAAAYDVLLDTAMANAEG